MLRSIVQRSQLRTRWLGHQNVFVSNHYRVAYYSQAAGTENVETVQKPQEEVYILKKKGRTPLHLRLKRLSIAKEKAQNRLIKLKPARYKEVAPPEQPPVATLAHGLDRVLFNPGIHYMKDPRTNTYNFPKFLEDITQPSDFDYEALQPYITSSKDERLAKMARDLGKRYVGSTSSVTAVLSHFYFALSNYRPVDTSILSQAFAKQPGTFTRGAQLPASIYLRWKDGVYAIDVDKSFDVEETILSIMGKSLEKVLTLSQPEYERYLKASETSVPEEERRKPETYAFGKFGNFLLRSQLDCQDPRLPRRTFDLKTRAAIPVRLDLNNYQEYLGYSLRRSHGLFESFEREYYDMMRSAFLKYNFQVRIGHMDGILVAYHNTRKIFGFQYISREEMDARLFGGRLMGDQAFHHCLALFDAVLTEATSKFPEQTLRLSFQSAKSRLSIFVEPVPKETEPPIVISSEEAVVDDEERSAADVAETLKKEEQEETEQVELEDDDVEEKEEEDKAEDFFKTDDPADEAYDGMKLYTLDISSYLNGTHQTEPFTVQRKTDRWSVRYRLYEERLGERELRHRFRMLRKKQQAIMVRKDLRGPMARILKSISERGYEIEKRKRE